MQVPQKILISTKQNFEGSLLIINFIISIMNSEENELKKQIHSERECSDCYSNNSEQQVFIFLAFERKKNVDERGDDQVSI